jgi:Ca2+-binding EF-hand superfamily protein
LYSNKDKEKLLKAFRDMDKDGDGVIGKDELLFVFNHHSESSLSQE